MKIKERRQGVVLVHTGEGKGKSSSALGMVFRAADLKSHLIPEVI